MTKTILLTLLIAGIFIFGSLATNEAFAAVDMFLKIEEIDGESTDKGHKDWIELESVTWSVETPTSGGVPTGPPTISGITVKNVLDKSSPNLFKAAVSGEHLRDVKIDFCRSDDKGCYLKYELENAMISKYNFGGSSSEDQLTESVTFNFAKIKVTYQKFDKGKPTEEIVEFSYDVGGGAT